MAAEHQDKIVDTLTLRFTGREEDGSDLHELRASHVADVLQGLAGIAEDFDDAGVFHRDGPGATEVLVRPAEHGSFLLEVVRVASENWATIAAVGGATGAPSLATVIWWATRSARAEVKDFDMLDNGNVKVIWQDDTAQEIPAKAWAELQKRDRRRKKQLRQIMRPLEDSRVAELDVSGLVQNGDDAPTETYVLRRADYDAVRPDDSVQDTQDVFTVEAQMSTINFDDPTKWKVKTKDRTRNAELEDKDFLAQVARGLAIRKNDIFELRIREHKVKKNGRTKTSWSVVRVINHRRAAGDNDS